MHDPTRAFTRTLGRSAALLPGSLAQPPSLPSIRGHPCAGIVAGPFTPGPLADVGIAVRAIAAPGAIVQSAIAMLLATLVALAAGWALGPGLGPAVAVVRAVVLVRALEEARLLDAPAGRAAIGWLLVEDIFRVVALVVLPRMVPAMADGAGGAGALAATVAVAVPKTAALSARVLGAGGRAIPWFLTQMARTRSRERFTLSARARSPRAPRWCSEPRWRWGRSWRAWWSARRASPRRRRTPSPCATPSRGCSSSRWGCCSTPDISSSDRSSCSASSP